MTILVTGAAGYIGSQIVHTLHRTFDQPAVIGLDNLSTGHTCPLPHGFECFHGEIGHRAFVGNLIDRYKVRQIIHCAAKVCVPESVEFPLTYYRNNAADTLALIEAAEKHHVQGIVFSSTAAVYGQPDLLVHRPIREDDPTKPMSPYGHSKLMAEQMLRDAHLSTGMSVVILRYFNVAGADPLGQTGQFTEHASHLVSRAVRAGLGLIPDGAFQVYGDGTDVRDYVHVADLAVAHLAALKALDWAGCVTFNVGSGSGHKTIDVVHEVSMQCKRVFNWNLAHRREGDPQSIIADTRLIREKLNWTPQHDLKEIVRDAIDWERSRRRPAGSYRDGNAATAA